MDGGGLKDAVSLGPLKDRLEGDSGIFGNILKFKG
jgi:hypothetical protein